MCVILALETQKELDSLTLEQLKNAESMNPDGNGFATLINGKVVFEKGVSIDDIWTKIKNGEIIAPAIIHCRITSVGKTMPELCHPFIVNKDSRNAMNGTISEDETALFHNGTFSEYKDLVLQTAMGAGRHLPSGEMSDTRGIAFVMQTLGIEALEYIDTGFNKFATLNAKQGLTRYGSWVDVDGIKSSNNYYATSITSKWGNFPKNSYYGYDEFNDEDTIFYNSDERAKQLEIENDNEPLYNMDKAQKGISEFSKVESKVSKKEHKMNKKFLKEHGWKSFAQFSKQELREIVNAMQQQNEIVKEIEHTKKQLSDKKMESIAKRKAKIFENSLTMEDYEDVIAYQKYNS
jgi:hypothetical protein